MICEECGTKLATVMITTVSGGEVRRRHLCVECMQKTKATMQDMLAMLLKSISPKAEPAPHITCERCGMTYAQFQGSGRLGCAHCYEAFSEPLKQIIGRIQGGTVHAGRRPPVSPEEAERERLLADLRARMDAAVAEENFEQAAALRDEIRSLTPAIDTGSCPEGGAPRE